MASNPANYRPRNTPNQSKNIPYYSFISKRPHTTNNRIENQDTPPTNNIFGHSPTTQNESRKSNKNENDNPQDPIDKSMELKIRSKQSKPYPSQNIIFDNYKTYSKKI